MVVFDMQTNNAGDRHRAVCRRCGWKSPWLERQVWAKRRFESTRAGVTAAPSGGRGGSASRAVRRF